MKLGHVVVSVNDHPKYFGFISIFAAAWRFFYPNIKLHIIYTGTSKQRLKILAQYFDVVESFPLTNFADSVMAAQVARIYYPGIIQSDEFIVTTDIDLIPLSEQYYLKVVPNYEIDSFIVMRNVIAQYKELPIGYNVATAQTWGDIFGVKDRELFQNQIRDDLSKVRHNGIHGGEGWTQDQRRLWNSVMDDRDRWDPDHKRLILLQDDDPGISFARLDREQDGSLCYFLDTDWQTLSAQFKDYHMPLVSEEIKEKFLEKFFVG